MPTIITKSYRDVIHEMQDGDALFYRGGWGPINWLIAAMGRSPYVHVGMVCGDHCLHMLQWSGGCEDPIRDLVARDPSRWDWYQVNPDNHWPGFDRHLAASSMVKLTRQPYGYRNVLLAAIRHLPFVRLFVRPLTDDSDTSPYPPHCADAIARACRAGGVDPVLNLADRVTEPGDLARSTFFSYGATLV